MTSMVEVQMKREPSTNNQAGIRVGTRTDQAEIKNRPTRDQEQTKQRSRTNQAEIENGPSRD